MPIEPPAPGQAPAKPPALRPGQATVVMAGGKEVALFNVGGKLYGVGNRCPHRSGPLFRGKVETVSGAPAVRCPIHGWVFELETGRCLTRPGASVPVFPLTCENGQLRVGAQQGVATGPSASGCLDSAGPR